MSIIRMYRKNLFEEVARENGHVSGYVLDRDFGKRLGELIVVPEKDVKLTGNDQYALDVSKMSESELLDEVMDNPCYLSDGYYRELGSALEKRYRELREIE